MRSVVSLITLPILLLLGGCAAGPDSAAETVPVAERRSSAGVMHGGGAEWADLVAPLWSFGATCDQATGTSLLWNDFVSARRSGREPILPDFSYAGYHYSERSLPAAAPDPYFDVTEYGAVPNDDRYDNEAIQAAIDAAVDAGGGTVYFPPGQYLLGPVDESGHAVVVRGDRVLLKGSGAGEGGTELLIDRPMADRDAFAIRIGDSAVRSRRLTAIVVDAARESFWIEVDDASMVQPGQWVVVRYRSPAYTASYFEPLAVPREWARLHDDGLRIHEVHRVERVEGNRVRFREPLHIAIRIHDGGEFDLATYPVTAEVGIEDLTIAGRWNEYPEEFRHHRDDIHDYGWNGLRLDRVANGWVRRVEFRDLNRGLLLHGSAAVTVENVALTGKKGHSAVHARLGYGILVKDVVDQAGHHHGPGVGYSAAGTVFLRFRMREDQQIDSHGGNPYATLFDDVSGGVLSGNGGSFVGYPHHAKHLVFWNFRHRSSRRAVYDFWSVDRRKSATFALPIFAGFQPNRQVVFEDEAEKVGFNESPGTPVTPNSLFMAQLAFRLCKRESEDGAGPRRSRTTGGTAVLHALTIDD